MRHQNMIINEMRQGIYSPTVDNTLSDLKKFQKFLIEISKVSKTDTTTCGQYQMSLEKFMQLLKLINLIY